MSPAEKAASIEERLTTMFASVIGLFILTPRPRNLGIFFIRSRSLGTLLPASAGILALGSLAARLAAMSAASDLLGLLVLVDWFEICICMVIILFSRRRIFHDRLFDDLCSGTAVLGQLLEGEDGGTSYVQFVL